MTLTDTHCHLDYHKFNEDREAVIQRAADAGLARSASIPPTLKPGTRLRLPI
jgi:TatD DNase family protein